MYRTCNRTSIDTALHHERHDTECTHGKYLCVLMIVASSGFAQVQKTAARELAS
jgi:hypothetical protein